MSVAVAHQPSTTGHLALLHATQEAVRRHTSLVVIQVADAVDLDTDAAHAAGLSDEIDVVLAEAELEAIDWELKLTASPEDVDQTATTILTLADEVGAEVLIIGARRRSPVGKFLLGSVTQKIILEAAMPVLVVKAPL